MKIDEKNSVKHEKAINGFGLQNNISFPGQLAH